MSGKKVMVNSCGVTFLPLQVVTQIVLLYVALAQLLFFWFGYFLNF